MADSIVINSDDRIVSVTDTETTLPIVITDENFTISEQKEEFTVEVHEDSVDVSNGEDNITISEDLSANTINFDEVLQIQPNYYITNVDNNTFNNTANGFIGGHRIVVVSAGSVSYASRLEPTHANIVAGVTTHAAANGESINITINGELIEPSWNWTIGTPIYLDTDGLMTQSVPTEGFVLIVGYPTSTTSMVVNIQTPILLG